jgi:CRP-like cAMP-binding protein
MADVKAITDCRTLTLQAEDFVELLLVVWLFFL